MMLVCEPPFPRISTRSIPDGQLSELKEASWAWGRDTKCLYRMPQEESQGMSVENLYMICELTRVPSATAMFRVADVPPLL